MKIIVLGVGGVGGLFGATLHHGGADVTFLARGAHLAAMQEHGLTVATGGTTLHVPPSHVVGSPSEAGPADVVLFCVKSYDIVDAAASLKPLLKPSTIVISLQNGVTNEDVIASMLPGTDVYGGVAYVFATITGPGNVTEWGGPKKIVFGPRTHAVDDRGRAILDLCVKAGVDASLTDDIRTALWRKFAFICTVGGLTALSRLTLGELLEHQESAALLRAALEECVAVAGARGIVLGPSFVEESFARARQFDPKSRSSLYHDLVNGKRLEIEALSGTIVRYGREAGIPVPIHTTIAAALLPLHRRAVAASGGSPV